MYMKDYTQSQRHIMIYKILSENPDGMNTNSIHNILKRYGYNVSERTIRRDMHCLSRILNISETDTRPVSYVLKEIVINNMNMSFNNLQAIRLIQELIKPYQHLDVGLNAERLMQKVLECLPTDQKNWLQHNSPLLQVNLSELVNENDYDPDIKNIVEQAILTEKCIKIKYYSFHNNTTQIRTIEPYFIEISEGCFHLWAYCHKRSEIRDFRLSRILSAEMTSKKYVRKEELLDIALSNRFENMSGREAVLIKLKFKGFSTRYVKEYYSKRADKLEDCNDGSVIFELNVAITPEIKRWILGFGSGVEVLEPADLREDIRKKAFKMLSVYEK